MQCKKRGDSIFLCVIIKQVRLQILNGEESEMVLSYNEFLKNKRTPNEFSEEKPACLANMLMDNIQLSK